MINYNEKFSLKGKKAVITGGTGLIGKEIVYALVQAGADVIIAGGEEKEAQLMVKELKQHSYSTKYISFDVTDLESLEGKVKDISESIGGIDIWVNSAYPRTKDFAGPVEDVTVESWRKNIDMHLSSYCLLSKYAAESMKKTGGSIINFGSIYGVVGNNPILYKSTKVKTSFGYAAIKGGIVSAVRFLAAHFGPDNIRINTICPGGIFDNQDPIFVERYSLQAPLKRMAYSHEIAPTVVFLASDAGAYITGATIMIDGGWTIV